MGDLDDLASLYLEWNRFPSFLPLSTNEQFIFTYINNNIINYIGDSLGNLSNLYFLDLGYNKINYVPGSICGLENLSYLWLFNNELDSLPDCFCDMQLNWSGMITVDIHTLQLEQIICVMKSLIAFIRAKTLNSVWINFITHFRFILLKIVM